MKTLLQINASLFSDDGQSSVLAGQFATQWLRANPDGEIVVRDLAANPVPHLTAERFQAFLAPTADRNAEQAALVAESDALIEELRRADVVVIGLPMYNFGIPSTLKAWIDHVARAGQTFKYTESGPVGLLKDKPVYLFASRGGLYHGTPRDTQSAYMTHFLNFIGLRNIEFVYAEGLALGDQPRLDALNKASNAIDRLAA
ncbi:MAG TPA: NAD(P)H-dependent oxidoreductase [Xanthomonadales bacterium]|nr:NAD(P)H-dependent oxidoreductase [Xanthomonadales bacterium]